MTTRFTGKPCFDCGKKKGINQNDRMRCFRCQKIADRKQRENRHATHIAATYGIDAKEYRALLAYQAGKCAICCRATGRTKRLAVDHNHACTSGHNPSMGCQECVRGLLCHTCNEYIGRMHDDPRVGERMAKYLRTPPWQELKERN